MEYRKYKPSSLTFKVLNYFQVDDTDVAVFNVFSFFSLSFFFSPDNEGPVVTYCPPDQTVTVSTRKSIITWPKPQFRDNSNGPLKVKCSHQSGTAFYWGTWKVQCTAHDSNPNNDPALCQFAVTLKRKWCVTLLLFA